MKTAENDTAFVLFHETKAPALASFDDIVGTNARLSAPTDFTFPAVALAHDGRLTRGERALIGTTRSSLLLTCDSNDEPVVVARKRMLRVAHAVMKMAGGIGIIDAVSQRIWTRDALDDELSIDADLDVDALYQLHAITNDKDELRWLHTHGLGEIGALDFDILRPSKHLVFHQDVVRAIAFAILDGELADPEAPFVVGAPNGTVRGVPAESFMANASPEDRALRDDDEHSEARIVICEPAGGRTKRPRPSAFTSSADDPATVIHFSEAASDLGAERARASTELLRRIADSVRGVPHEIALKIGYETAHGSLEHLWFRAHGFVGEAADATLLNEPHAVPSLKLGVRGRQPLDRVTDWMVMTREGIISSRDTTPLRRLREAGAIR